jgi:hypothetical protein
LSQGGFYPCRTRVLLRRDYSQKSAPPLLRLLRSRSTSNANVSRRHNDKLAGRQLVRVFLQRLIQVLSLGLQLGPRKPEKQDARVRKPLVKDQLSEIAVSNDEDPLLLSGNRQDVLIRQTMRVISGDGRNVVAKASKMVDKASTHDLLKIVR